MPGTSSFQGGFGARAGGMAHRPLWLGDCWRQRASLPSSGIPACLTGIGGGGLAPTGGLSEGGFDLQAHRNAAAGVEEGGICAGML